MENYKSNSGTLSSGLLAANKSVFWIIHGILNNGFITTSYQTQNSFVQDKRLSFNFSFASQDCMSSTVETW